MEYVCKNCKHLSFSDCYGECDKHVKIVRPDETCNDYEPSEEAKRKMTHENYQAQFGPDWH